MSPGSDAPTKKMVQRKEKTKITVFAPIFQVIASLPKKMEGWIKRTPRPSPAPKTKPAAGSKRKGKVRPARSKQKTEKSKATDTVEATDDNQPDQTPLGVVVEDDAPIGVIATPPRRSGRLQAKRLDEEALSEKRREEEEQKEEEDGESGWMWKQKKPRRRRIRRRSSEPHQKLITVPSEKAAGDPEVPSANNARARYELGEWRSYFGGGGGAGGGAGAGAGAGAGGGFFADFACMTYWE